MTGQMFAFIGLLAFAAALSAVLARETWQRRSAPGAGPFALVLVGVTLWTAGYALELAAPDLGGKLFFAKLLYPGVVAVPVAWLIFAFHYTGRDAAVAGPRLIWLAAIPAITLALVWTNEAHGLVWSAWRLETDGPLVRLAVQHGWWFWVFAAYTYLLLGVATLLIVMDLIRSGFLFRAQGVALLVGTLAPWIGNVIYLTKLSAIPDLDLTPFAFTLSGLAVSWALYRYKLLDIVPVAFDKVVRDLADGVVVINSHDRVVALNRAAGEVLNLAPTAIGRPLDVALNGQPELLEALRGVTDRRELTIGRGREERYFDVQVSPLKDPAGRLTGRIVILHDLTVRRRAEAEHLELLRQQAERAEVEARLRARNELLSSLSHDLRNPLTAIKATSDVLARRVIDPRLADPVKMLAGIERIDDQVGVMRRLLDELVELSQLQVGQDLDLDRRPTDLVALVRRIAADQAAVAGPATIEVESSHPALTGEWDALRLERVITNLLTNAIKYSPSGGRVRIRLDRESSPDGDRAVLAVSDQGLGIPASDLPRIFEWFYRAENVAGRIAGTGVGLAGSRRIVEQHGGTLTVESREGEGSTFTVRLPIAPVRVSVG